MASAAVSSVNDPWDETTAALDETDAVSDDATVVSDAEGPQVKAFTDEDRGHQLDLCHVGRPTSYKLWEDDAFPLAEREQLVSEVNEELFHLKNSVEKHRPADNLSAIQSRIDTTTDRLQRLAWQLEMLSCPKTATYLRSWLSSVVTFADAAVDGDVVHWTSNPVERAMGEVSNGDF